jgi:hypothetical protein
LTSTLAGIIKKSWWSLSEEQKQVYKDRAGDEARDHKQLHPNYNFQPDREKGQRKKAAKMEKQRVQEEEKARRLSGNNSQIQHQPQFESHPLPISWNNSQVQSQPLYIPGNNPQVQCQPQFELQPFSGNNLQIQYQPQFASQPLDILGSSSQVQSQPIEQPKGSTQQQDDLDWQSQLDSFLLDLESEDYFH